MNKRLLALLSAALVALGAAACGDTDDPSGDSTDTSAGAQDNALSIVERDYAFDISGEPAGGTLSIQIDNAGKELHELIFTKLLDGKTFEEAKAALDAAGEEDEDPLAGLVESDSVIDDFGGGQAPGTRYTITGPDVEAGEYVLRCNIPNAEGVPHFKLGMLAQVSIAEGSGGTAPEGEVTYTATDDQLEGPETLDAGETAIEVVNDSAASREITLLKLASGKTMEDAGKFFESATEGPPDFANSPFEFFTFVFDSERDRTITVDLTAGQWGIQVADPEHPFEGPPTEDPHAVLFTVA